MTAINGTSGADVIDVAPKADAVSILTMTASKATYSEGELATIDFFLPGGGRAGIASFTVTLTTSAGSVSNTYGVSFGPGDEHFLYTFRLYDDAVQGGTIRYDITVKPLGTLPDPRVVTQTLSFAVQDNDLNGFGVSLMSSDATYKVFTRLDHILNADDVAYSQLNADFFAKPLSERQWVRGMEKFALGTTSVALAAYQFFTGKAPTEAGIDYLVSPTGPNANNLNSAYYQSFGVENRYINFAVNLGKVGEGAAAFSASYGGLSLFDATRKAYATIFGAAPTDDKIHALIDGRADYFSAYGGDGPNGQGTKAAMVGWLLVEALKADVGAYAHAVDNFYMDLTDGSAHFNVDLVQVYGPGTFLDSLT